MRPVHTTRIEGHHEPAHLNPIWVGRFEVAGPRDNKYMGGYPCAFLWIAAQVEGADELRARVDATMAKSGVTLVKAEELQLVTAESKLGPEARKVAVEARRHVDVILCGKWHGYEATGERPAAFLELKTERLLLRPWHRKDRDEFAAMNADREVMHYFLGPMSRRQSDEAVDRYLADFEKYGFSFLVAEVRETKAFAGIIGVQVMRDIIPNLAQPAFEIGWRLNRAHQGKGYATEGARAVVNLAFNHFLFDEVVAITAVANTASRRVMEKLGMTHRPELDFDHPRIPSQHLYVRHTLYQLRNPSLGG